MDVDLLTTLKASTRNVTTPVSWISVCASSRDLYLILQLLTYVLLPPLSPHPPLFHQVRIYTPAPPPPQYKYENCLVLVFINGRHARQLSLSLAPFIHHLGKVHSEVSLSMCLRRPMLAHRRGVLFTCNLALSTTPPPSATSLRLLPIAWTICWHH